MAIKRLDFRKHGFSIAEAVNATFWGEIDWHTLPTRTREKLLKKCESKTNGDTFRLRVGKRLLDCIWYVDEPNVVESVKCRRVKYKRGEEHFEVYFERGEDEAVAFCYSLMDYIAVVPVTQCREMAWKDVTALVNKALSEAPNTIMGTHKLNAKMVDERTEARKKCLEETKKKWEEKKDDQIARP